MPPRYTIRQVVGTYRRKAFGTRNGDGTKHRPPYPADAVVAFYGMLELAEEQPKRGHFESERLLRILLEGPDGHGRRYARQVPFLIAQADLVLDETGGLDVEGWEILQEGDTTIADRVSRFRARKRAAGNGPDNGPANAGANGDVTAGLTVPVTDEPRAGMARASRPARNAVATDSATATGFGGGSGSAGESRARSNGLSRIALDDLPAGLAVVDELPTAPTTTPKGDPR